MEDDVSVLVRRVGAYLSATDRYDRVRMLADMIAAYDEVTHDEGFSRARKGIAALERQIGQMVSASKGGDA